MMEIDDLLAAAPDEVTRLNAQSISTPYRWFLVANNSAGDNIDAAGLDLWLFCV